jgi:amino acid transporter
MAPAPLGRRRANGSPALAVIVYSASAALFGNLGDFNRLANVSTIAVVAQYIATCGAVLVLRHRVKSGAGRRPGGFRLPLGPTVPLAALVACAAFLRSVQPSEARAAGAILAAGYLLRLALVVARRRRRPA